MPLNQEEENIHIFSKKGSSEGLIIILTGIGGSLSGYDGKYEKIAKDAYDSGLSVLIATTPRGSWNHLRENLEFVMDQASILMGGKEFPCLLAGSSAGANIALCYAYLYSNIKYVLAINPVMNVNIHKIRNGVNSFHGAMMKTVIGEQDSSFPYVGFLPKCDKHNLITIPQIDHNFTNRIDLFVKVFSLSIKEFVSIQDKF